MAKVTFDYSKAASFVSEEEVQSMSKIAESAKELLLSGEGAGNDFLGWVDLPVNYDKEEFDRIKKAAQKIQSDSDVLLVIGIGGSYLGARAANEFLNHNFFNCLTKEQRKAPEIYYVGNSISSTYVSQLRDVLKDKDFSVNIIFLPVSKLLHIYISHVNGPCPAFVSARLIPLKSQIDLDWSLLSITSKRIHL